MDIGMIGLGTMGLPMARNLLAAGFRVSFYCRRDEPAQKLIPLGASRASSPAALLDRAEIVVSIVTADAAVEEIALGERGLASGAASGKLFVDMSTISPATVVRVAERLSVAGMKMLDAPVSGGPAGAAAATLAIMVGGAAEDVERARPVLSALGKRVFHVGPLGTGQTVKLVNQLLGSGAMALIGEGMAIARLAGVDLGVLCDAIEASSGNSALFQARARKYVLAGDYTPAFTTHLMHKDLRLALELAASYGVEAPVARTALAQYAAALDRGWGGEDFSAVAKVPLDKRP